MTICEGTRDDPSRSGPYLRTKKTSKARRRKSGKRVGTNGKARVVNSGSGEKKSSGQLLGRGEIGKEGAARKKNKKARKGGKLTKREGEDGKKVRPILTPPQEEG